MASTQLFHALERQMAEVETLKIRMNLAFDFPAAAILVGIARHEQM